MSGDHGFLPSPNAVDVLHQLVFLQTGVPLAAREFTDNTEVCVRGGCRGISDELEGMVLTGST